MADVLFTSQALDATARLLPMFAVTATAKHLVAKAKKLRGMFVKRHCP